MAQLIVVVGGQFGSEGKGAVCGWLADEMKAETHDIAIRVAGPNAGHTVIDPKTGTEWKLRAVPVAAVRSDCQLQIAAGSEIDTQVLLREIEELDKAGFNVSARLRIHPNATLLETKHVGREAGVALVENIGSTGKGIGAARADRIMRSARLVKDEWSLRGWLGDWVAEWRAAATAEMDDPIKANTDIQDAGILIEGTQGYGLGLHTDHYPYVTSSDCRAIDFLAMAGISPWEPLFEENPVATLVVARAYPIRVAGNSGPLQGETTWDALGLLVERTTVTNKVRRVGDWDPGLVAAAVAANGGSNCRVILTMVDQVFPDIRDNGDPQTWPGEVHDWIKAREAEIGTTVVGAGVGPNTYVELA